MKKAELLAPAGSFEKLKIAFLYGADAVYAGGKEFSLRVSAENFTLDEFEKAIEYTHSLGKKLYVTVNIYAKNSDLKAADEYFKRLKEMGADAVLVSDPGLLNCAIGHGLEVHLSTQANTQNVEAVKFWASRGVKRVVLGRELTLSEIAEISKASEIETEVFVHGAMCVSYSGRCLLSNFFTNRDANRGECAQVCRWDFTLSHERHSDKNLTVTEDGRGTYFMNSKDLVLLRYIPYLIEAGVDSFKIEGRMKSEYYLATVVNAYRRAMDEYYSTGKISNVESYMSDIGNVVNHGYTEAFALGDNEHTINYTQSKTQPKSEFIAIALSDGGKDGVTVEMRNRFKKGQTLFLLSPSEKHGRSFKIDKIVNSKGEEIDDAKIVQERVTLFPPFDCKAGDIFRS